MAKKKRSNRPKPRPQAAKLRVDRVDDESSSDESPASNDETAHRDEIAKADREETESHRDEGARAKAKADREETESRVAAKGQKSLPQARVTRDTLREGPKSRPGKKSKPWSGKPKGVDLVPEPRFWFGFEVTWAKLVLARVVVFSLLALDALLQIRHAPRYGAGDFNVAQLGFLDALGPGRVAYGACQLLIAYFCVLAVFNVATRLVVPIAAVLYAWLYFGSQLDSYQHHYLVALMLGIASFIPWARPVDAEPGTPVRSWAVRLLLVQLAIMYLWAAISKLDAVWLDGSTLGSQITGSLRSVIDGTVGFRAASVMVIVVELALAAMIWMRPTWIIAAPLGIAFHLGIVATGFEIGLFAYVMCALYILVVPDALWVMLGDGLRPIGQAMQKLGDRPGWAAVIAGVVVAIGLALLVRLPNALAIAIATSLFVIALGVRALTRGGPPLASLGYAHAIAIVLWLVVDRATTVAVDYYRFWGGSQRRLGDTVQAEAAYRKLVQIAPSEEVGHFQLARILIATDRADEGIEALHAAQRADPKRARAFSEEARWLAAQGRKPEAIAKAKDAVVVDPSDGDARALLDSLTGAKPAPGPRPAPRPDIDP
ncbi:MAG: HTTM domain-containing protein [Deltaproteobacteria bacterium]|nr:HTTM domain-containing protein [Deltaproteobacteria bacterium]